MGHHRDWPTGRHFRRRRRKTVMEQVRSLIGSYYRLLTHRTPRQ